MSATDILFFGRFHPVAVHFPIGILSAVALIELLAIVRPRRGSERPTGFLLILGTLGAIAAAALGLALEEGGGYDTALLERHETFGLTVVGLFIAASILKGLHHRLGRPKLLLSYRLAGAAGIAALILAGHYGGSLTHGSDYLTQYMPSWLPFAPKGDRRPGEAGDSDAFTARIEPILSAHCFECHGPDRERAGLRLDRRASMLAPVKSGKPVVVAGDAMASELVRRITLPRDRDGAMPPAGKAGLRPEDVIALIEWIDRGAP
ncbi:MAG: hypothetical protein JXP34_09840 [Planctomycetes bacterium]|nr:hypothetical protein [Planctomycetota bacterium]